MRLLAVVTTTVAIATLTACGEGYGPDEARGPGPVVLEGPGANEYGVGTAIWITGPDGKRPRRLTLGTTRVGAGHDDQPELSADGERVAFVHWTPCPNRKVKEDEEGVPESCTAIWTINADGSSPTAVIGPDEATDYLSPSWSPDGDEIAYVRMDHASERTDVYVMDADGNDERRLTHVGDAADPTWSPDGDEIAFSRLDYHPSSDLYVVEVEDGDVRQLTRTAEDGEIEPDWSPDGNWIAYEGAISGEYAVDYMVFVMRADGTDARILRDPGADMNTSPVWSPDSKQVIYTSERNNGESEIWIASRDGTTKPTVLIDDAELN